jgi:hypothetical protein
MRALVAFWIALLGVVLPTASHSAAGGAYASWAANAIETGARVITPSANDDGRLAPDVLPQSREVLRTARSSFDASAERRSGGTLPPAFGARAQRLDAARVTTPHTGAETRALIVAAHGGLLAYFPTAPPGANAPRLA